MKKPIRSNRLYTFLLFDGLRLKEETKADYSSRNRETSGHGFFQFDLSLQQSLDAGPIKERGLIWSKRSGLEVEKVGFGAGLGKQILILFSIRTRSLSKAPAVD